MSTMSWNPCLKFYMAVTHAVTHAPGIIPLNFGGDLNMKSKFWIQNMNLQFFGMAEVSVLPSALEFILFLNRMFPFNICKLNMINGIHVDNHQNRPWVIIVLYFMAKKDGASTFCVDNQKFNMAKMKYKFAFTQNWWNVES